MSKAASGLLKAAGCNNWLQYLDPKLCLCEIFLKESDIELVKDKQTSRLSDTFACELQEEKMLVRGVLLEQLRYQAT